jgi:hypothetical protein
MPINLARVFDIREERSREIDHTFAASTRTVEKINFDKPLDRIECYLDLQTDAGSGNSLNGNGEGGLNLISRLRLVRDGKDVLFDLPGFLLRHVSDMYTANPAHVSAPAMSGSNEASSYAFTIPVNMGPEYLSLLDPEQWQSLTLEVEWGAMADMASGGTGFNVDSGTLHVECVGVGGGAEGEPGGVNLQPNGYPLHYINHDIITVTAAQANLRHKLLPSVMYARTVLYTESDASAVNTILNHVDVKLGSSILQKHRATHNRAQALARYGWTTQRTGLHVIDFADRFNDNRPINVVELLGHNSNLDFALVMDVSKPGTTDQIYVVQDFIANDQQATGLGRK